MRRMIALFVHFLFLGISSQTVVSLVLPRYHSCQSASSSFGRKRLILHDATGGWGIGSSRDMVPEEFAKGSDRRAFEGYKMTDRGEFMRQVKSEQDEFKKQEIDELMGVAKIAGIDMTKKTTNRVKFDPSLFSDEDDDLDVSVEWDEPDPFSPPKSEQSSLDSITRFDEDTGAPGVW